MLIPTALAPAIVYLQNVHGTRGVRVGRLLRTVRC